MGLVNEVLSGKGAGENDEKKRGDGPEDDGPGIGECEPDGDEEHEAGEIGKGPEQDAFVFGSEEILPATWDGEGVGIEKERGDEEADSELGVGRGDGLREAIKWRARGLRKVIVERRESLVDEHVPGRE